MRVSRWLILVVVLVALAVAGPDVGTDRTSRSDLARRVQIGADPFATQQLAEIALSFEENVGQAAEPVRFLARGAGYQVLLAPTEVVVAVGKDDPAVVGIKLLHASTPSIVAGEEELGTVSNYLRGGTREHWRRGLRNFAKVRYSDVYPGVDVVYHGDQNQLEYDFVLAPGADARQIRLHYDRP